MATSVKGALEQKIQIRLLSDCIAKFVEQNELFKRLNDELEYKVKGDDREEDCDNRGDKGKVAFPAIKTLEDCVIYLDGQVTKNNAEIRRFEEILNQL